MMPSKGLFHMIAIDSLKFDKDGLIPAIVVDSITKQVLTLAYMNRESLTISMENHLLLHPSRMAGGGQAGLLP